MTLRNIISATIITLACAEALAQSENRLVVYQDQFIVEDKSKDVTIDIVNNVDFTAFQLDINIPDYIHFVANADGKYITRGSRLTDSHVVTEKLINDLLLRVIVYSTANDAFASGPGNLFIYSVAANNSELDSEGNTIVNNIIFSQVDTSDPDGVNCLEYKFDDYTISSAVTSVEQVAADSLTIYAEGSNIIVLSPTSTTLQLTNVAGITTPLAVKAGKNVFPMNTPGVYIVNDTKVVVE